MRFTKAHATGNDFVLIADPQAQQHLDAKIVAALCDRHTGIGADGLIRAVPAHSSDDGRNALEVAGLTSTQEAPLWFMDYRNADVPSLRCAATGCGPSRISCALRASQSSPTALYR